MSAACRRSRRSYDIPVWLTFGTLAVVGERFDGMPRVYGFDSHDGSRSATLEVAPFPVPHDAREPVQFVVSDGARRLGVLTDIGMSTPHVEASLSGCDALVLECNHDRGDARERRLSAVAEAAHRGPLRPSAQRGGGGAARARSTRSRLAAHRRRAPVAAEQHAGAGARRAGRRARLRAGLDRHRRPGRRIRLARDDADRRRAWKSGRSSTRGKAKTVYATDDPH